MSPVLVLWTEAREPGLLVGARSRVGVLPLGLQLWPLEGVLPASGGKALSCELGEFEVLPGSCLLPLWAQEGEFHPGLYSKGLGEVVEPTLPSSCPGRHGTANCASHAEASVSDLEEELSSLIVVQLGSEDLAEEVGKAFVQFLRCLLRHHQGAYQVDVGALGPGPGQDQDVSSLQALPVELAESLEILFSWF